MRALAIVMLTAVAAHAEARPPAPVLTDLAMPAGDDARRAIAIGPVGQVYEPDGRGAWRRERPIAMADTVVVVGRANGVVALADGAVYRLADNGWSALRLVQKGKAVMSGGARAVAAVGRQLFALDRLAGGEVAKLAMAPQAVQLVGAGTKALTIQTERGLLRAESAGAAWKPIARAPRRVQRLIDDRWALTDRGAVDLKTGTETAWPSGFRAGAVTPGAKGTLLVVGAHRGVIELVVIDGVKVTREPIAPPEIADASPRPGAPTRDTAARGSTVKPGTKTAPGPRDPEKAGEVAPGAKAGEPAPSGAKDGEPTTSGAKGGEPAVSGARDAGAPLADPVGVVADTAGRVVVAFRDGRLAIRERGVWSLTAVADALPAPRPGAPPARSP